MLDEAYLLSELKCKYFLSFSFSIFKTNEVRKKAFSATTSFNSYLYS